MIQSAEEYLRINFELEITKDRIGYVQSSDAYKAMIEFARLHVQAALQEASEKAKVIMVESCSDHTPYWGVCGTCGSYTTSLIPTEEIDEASILNAYPESNIK
jgi:hypothetical protein